MTNDFSNRVRDVLLAPAYNSEQYVEQYLKPHMRRFQVTVALLNEISAPAMRVVDVGSYGSLVPALIELLGVQDITVTKPQQKNSSNSQETCLTEAQHGDKYRFRVDRFDIEDTFPYPNASFDIVIFTEVLEHIALDPVRTVSELNRITQPGGWLLLSTPNCVSSKSVSRILRGANPYLYPVYTKQPSRDRHNREYTPGEVKQLLVACGYELAKFETLDVYDDNARLALQLIYGALRVGAYVSLGLIEFRERGDTIFAIAKKVSAVRERYPSFLYA